MNGDRFQSLLLSLGKTTSRRATLRWLAGALLGTAAIRLGLDGAAAGPAGIATNRCRRGKRLCDGQCVDTETDRRHCGRCGKRCRAGECVPTCARVLTAAGCTLGDDGLWQCQGADLRGANLGGCDLAVALLDSADLSGADLTDANLNAAVAGHANFTGADLNGADLTSVLWFDTICPDGTNSDDHGSTCCGHLNGAVPKAGC